MQGKKKYWKGLEELYKTPEFETQKHNEFPEFLPVKESAGDKGSEGTAPRRDFLKLLGFGMAAVTLASCEAPVRKAIPYLNKPEDIEPGIPNWYASTYFTGSDYNAVLVKTREGRPIKLEGNPQSSLTEGGLSARAQASLLSLYDNNRIQAPYAQGKQSDWDKVDAEITAALGNVTGKVVLISQTIISPTTKQAIRDFAGKQGSFEHITYDPNSAYALLAANGGVIPGYEFDKAKVIVSVGADFLGTWISPIEYATDYIENRKVSKANPVMSRHYQFEPFFSITGANADIRAGILPSDEARVVDALHAYIVGGSTGNVEGLPAAAQIKKAAQDLMGNRGAALVVAGSNDVSVQNKVKEINQSLGAEGTTINTNAPSYVRQGNDVDMFRILQEMENGGVGAVIFYNSNPLYTYPLANRFKNALAKVGLKISLADRLDETAIVCDYVCPDHNFLEAWNDYEPRRGYISFAQPTISPIFATRHAQESLLTWSGNKTPYYEYLRNNWRKYATGNFNTFWEKALHDGVLENVASTGMNEPVRIDASATAQAPAATAARGANTLEVTLYESVNMGTGEQANNPWLLELPDPISKACWGNYVAMSQTMAKEQGYEQGDVVRVTVETAGERRSLELPVLVQPGQHKSAIAIAVGFGRQNAGPAANNVGANAYPLASVSPDGRVLFASNCTIEKTDSRTNIAQTQTHHTIMGRNIVQEAPLTQYKADPSSVTEYIRIATAEGAKKPAAISLWKDYEYKDHHWGMVIDLNSCIGCGSCVMACQVENNIPVVGKQEIYNRREMHWLRIDRYYSSDATSEDGHEAMENPSDNPSVIFQPMLCQHCNHAPCETVCPVAATMHSTEGLNQMAYNRCVGTRYCANNCPYKVRRFNWFAYANNDKFDFNMNNDLGKMALNPDVVVRARGVMEKCSFCVQRIQQGKLQAKKEKRRTLDGEIQTACSQSCPTNAIVFGDMLDGTSKVSELLQREKGERAFHVLEELNTQPNVTYLTQIRNLA